MADDSKKQIKWLYVLFALGLIAYYFYPKGKDLTAGDLSSKTVTLSRNVITISGTHHSSSYLQLWTKETKAAFTIGSPGEVVAPDRSLDSLKKGDTLSVKYSNVHDYELDIGSKEIPIYYLQKGKRVYFELSSYNKAQDAATARYKVISIFGSILLLLYGFNVINQKYTWIAVGTGVVLFIILRALDMF